MTKKKDDLPWSLSNSNLMKWQVCDPAVANAIYLVPIQPSNSSDVCWIPCHMQSWRGHISHTFFTERISTVSFRSGCRKPWPPSTWWSVLPMTERQPLQTWRLGIYSKKRWKWLPWKQYNERYSRSQIVQLVICLSPKGICNEIVGCCR